MIALVALCPDVVVGSRLHQSCGDADPSVRAENRTFHDRIDVQLLGDSKQRLARVLVLHRRRTRDDAQPFERRQMGDQLVRKTFGEVLLLRIAGQVFQRQDDEGANRYAAVGRTGAAETEAQSRPTRTTTESGRPAERYDGTRKADGATAIRDEVGKIRLVRFWRPDTGNDSHDPRRSRCSAAAPRNRSARFAACLRRY